MSDRPQQETPETINWEPGESTRLVCGDTSYAITWEGGTEVKIIKEGRFAGAVNITPGGGSNSLYIS